MIVKIWYHIIIKLSQYNIIDVINYIVISVQQRLSQKTKFYTGY